MQLNKRTYKGFVYLGFIVHAKPATIAAWKAPNKNQPQQASA